MKKMLKKLTLVGMMSAGLVIAGAQNNNNNNGNNNNNNGNNNNNKRHGNNNNNSQSVPEPATLMLLGAGVAGVAGLVAAKRRRKV